MRATPFILLDKRTLLGVHQNTRRRHMNNPDKQPPYGAWVTNASHATDVFIARITKEGDEAPLTRVQPVYLTTDPDHAVPIRGSTPDATES